MRLSFEDAHGETGVVTDDLAVEYAGEWEPQVRACVDRVEREQRGQYSGDPTVDVYSQLIIDLPRVVPIVEVERDRRPVRSTA